MKLNQTTILSVVLALQVGWALPGCGGAGSDAGALTAAGASSGGSEQSAGNASVGASAGTAEPTGGASSGAGGSAMGGEGEIAAGSASGGGEGESAGSSNAGAGGSGGMCIMPGGDSKTCVLDHQTKRDAATACNPSAPDQCQDRITDDCGCQVAVNDADSPEVACYLATLAEGSCSLCTPEPCAAPLGECEVARDRPTFCR